MKVFGPQLFQGMEQSDSHCQMNFHLFVVIARFAPHFGFNWDRR